MSESVIPFTICLDVESHPHLHFENDGALYTETAHEEGQRNFLLWQCATWKEVEVPGSHMQHALVTPLEKEWEIILRDIFRESIVDTGDLDHAYPLAEGF